MTVVQWTVRAAGWLFVLLGMVGFAASGLTGDADPATAPRAFDLFPVNAAQNAVHLGFGLWAMVAYHRPRRAKRYATVTGPAYLLLALLGLFSPSLFGLAPIGGHNLWLHAALGVLLSAVGFTAPAGAGAAEEPPPRPDRHGGH